jgi:hypothetical protein
MKRFSQQLFPISSYLHLIFRFSIISLYNLATMLSSTIFRHLWFVNIIHHESTAKIRHRKMCEYLLPKIFLLGEKFPKS